MKIFALISITIALATTACSSKPKVEEAAKPATPAVTAPATNAAAPSATAAAPADKKSPKGKKAKAAAVAAAKVETTEAVSTAGVLTCTQGSDTRTVEVKAKDKGCEVIYTKKGEAKSVASEIKGTAHCEAVSQKISKNLTASGMTCK